MRERRSSVKKENLNGTVSAPPISALNLPLKPYRATGAGPQASSGHSGGLDQFLQLALLSVVVAVILPPVTASPDFSLNKSTARYVLQKDPTGSRKTLQQAVRGGADRV
jgi:hypothetical protein